MICCICNNDAPKSHHVKINNEFYLLQFCFRCNDEWFTMEGFIQFAHSLEGLRQIARDKYGVGGD